MSRSILMLALVEAFGVGACARQPAGPPGEPGAQGATGFTGDTGQTGATGKTGSGTTVIVEPSTPSASN